MDGWEKFNEPSLPEKDTNLIIIKSELEYAMLFIDMQKLITNTIKVMIKKESSYLEHSSVNYLHGWAMSQKFPFDGLKWVEETSQVNEDFIKIIMHIAVKHIILQLMFSIKKNCVNFIMIYHFYQKE